MKKLFRGCALLLCAVLLCSLLPAASAAGEISITSLKTAGFTVENFSGESTYYLCYPKKFSGIQFTDIKTNVSANVTISVERYCDYDYVVNYTVGETLNLGYGRARVSVTVTDKADATNTKTYLFAFTDPKQDQYYYAYRTGVTKVYTNTSTTSALLATLPKGSTYSTMLLCVGTSGNWTKVVIPSAYSKYHGQVGWVQTTDLLEEYAITDTPYSYKPLIDTLKKNHPNWTFEYRHMGVDINQYAQKIATIYKQNSGKTVDIDTVLAAMNPVNHLNEQNIFMFLDVTRYNASDYTDQGLRALWVESSKAVCTEDEAVQYFTEAGKSLRLNAYHLMARAALESGHGTSNLSKGKVGTDGKLYYNFYGIKAYDKNPSTGAVYAEQRGWDSPFRSIAEGGNWINDQYIQRGQKTPYFFRFYPFKDHLYMSDLQAPAKDAKNLYTCYKGAGKLNTNLHFVIPVFDGIAYPDVSEKAWYYEDVYRATEYELFEGMKDGNFCPEQQLTRAQLVTVLARISGADISKSAVSNFKDINQKDWFYRAVSWGYIAGVVKGLSDGTFAPNQPITRQELCTMLVRFAENYNITMKTATLQFSDSAKIASWAKDGVTKCVGEKFVNGMPNGTFCPTDSATRAQAAKILSLFYEQYFFLV